LVKDIDDLFAPANKVSCGQLALLKNIFESGELVEASVVSILETTAGDGETFQTT